MRRFVSDACNPEAPVSLPDGGWYFAEMGRGVVSRVDAAGGGRVRVVATGRPNGLAVDRKGTLWIAESLHPSLQSLTTGGERATVSTGSRSCPFLWPNDLCFGRDGLIYMTDSGILFEEFSRISPIRNAYKSQIDGRVFVIDPRHGETDVLDSGLSFANGIALDADGEYLYVSETLTGNIFRYRLPDGKRETFANVMENPSESYDAIAGPDGMAFGLDGRLYVAVLTEACVAVVSQTGIVAERIPVPGSFPTNIAFDARGRTRIMVTEGSTNSLFFQEVSCKGLSLFG